MFIGIGWEWWILYAIIIIMGSVIGSVIDGNLRRIFPLLTNLGSIANSLEEISLEISGISERLPVGKKLHT